MSNLVEHAKREFEILGWPGDDKMQAMICDNIIELLQTFSDQGHSGSTAPYALAYFNKLANFDPISPLTGEDSEWVEVGGGDVNDKLYQNNRDCEVFKDGEGNAWWIHGKIFRDANGCTYTNSDSHVKIAFPWTKPEPKIIDVDG